jgi:hypothetical protein
LVADLEADLVASGGADRAAAPAPRLQLVPTNPTNPTNASVSPPPPPLPNAAANASSESRSHGLIIGALPPAPAPAPLVAAASSDRTASSTASITDVIMPILGVASRPPEAPAISLPPPSALPLTSAPSAPLVRAVSAPGAFTATPAAGAPMVVLGDATCTEDEEFSADGRVMAALEAHAQSGVLFDDTSFPPTQHSIGSASLEMTFNRGSNRNGTKRAVPILWRRPRDLAEEGGGAFGALCTNPSPRALLAAAVGERKSSPTRSEVDTVDAASLAAHSTADLTFLAAFVNTGELPENSVTRGTARGSGVARRVEALLHDASDLGSEKHWHFFVGPASREVVMQASQLGVMSGGVCGVRCLLHAAALTIL